MRTVRRVVVAALRCVALLLLFLPGRAQAAVPSDMNLQGFLATSSGSPANGTYTLTVSIYPTIVGGTPATALWTSTFAGVTVDGGVYDITLSSLPLNLFRDNGSLWIETKVGNETPLPRRQLLPLGYAFHARTSETAAMSGDLDCPGCVGSTDLGSGLAVDGSFTVQQSAILCDGGAGSCYVQLNNTARLAAEGAGVTVQANNGLKIRNFAGSGWAALQSGNITANGNVSITGNLTVGGTITGTIGAVPWSALTGVPAGFADGNDANTTYSAGPGLALTGTTFSADLTYVQKTIGGSCSTGEAIRVVKLDGTVTCAPVGATYTAAANGGLNVSTSNEVSLLTTCTSGQVLKHDGTKWKCDTDAVGGVTSFSQLQGSASDGQIPDNITINMAKDSDKVDGHHYQAVWDSTDAQTLQGHPASYFATKSEHNALAATVVDPPAVHQTICDASLPTNVCKKDVYMADTHTRDGLSMAALSGGAWVYYEAGERCEYQGGEELDDPKSCGQDLMPDWMDTTDDCGGFRQSTWDTRVRFAVGKSNKWDKTFNYTCPAGYHWGTTQEVKPWLNGPNTGNRTYYDQCGWLGYSWKGKTRHYFRFKDSATQQNSYKHAGNYDPYQIEYSAALTEFAGIVCVQDAPPGKLDWMITEDACGGFKQSTWDPRFYWAVSRKTVFDKDYDYQCPDGFHWATTAEGYAAFNGTTNQGYLYHDQCGWNAYDMHSNGLIRHYFRFKDSFKDSTTLAYKHAGNADMYQVQFNDASLGNFAGIVCMDDNYSPTPTDWMETSDYCGGFRQNTWDPRFAFAVAKQNVWDKNKDYSCPSGWHWASTAEVDAAFPNANPNEGQNYVYHGQCGWSTYYWNGVYRYHFRMSDSKNNNRYVHAGWWDPYRGATDAATASFAGIICKKDGSDPYPKPGTTDWMLTDDDCGGFRESSWDSRIRYAVARQNVWDKSFDYECPSGYHWGSKAEVSAMVPGFNTSYLQYNGQCGWAGYYWHGRYRLYFRFSDSASNNHYLHAGHGDPYGSAGADATLGNFAGIVCVADTDPTDPTDWMDKTDNCGGFRQSTWDTRVRFAVSKNTNWQPGKVYACPTGYHWMSSLEAQGIFDLGEYGADRTYYSQCGWNGYNWHGIERYYFRFSDSHENWTFKHSYYTDPYPLQTSTATTNFAGIVCMQDGTVDPTEWMDKTDNCGGFRQSVSDPDVFYAVSKSNVWDKGRTYTCPTGYHWATTSEGTSRFDNSPVYPYNAYNGQCGWSGYDWNAGWPLGCGSYGQAGCGSTYLSPTPTMWQRKTGTFTSGCDECDGYYATTCSSVGLTSGPDGKCGGISEAHWQNDQHIDDCYESPNSFGGNPLGMVASTNGDHCKDGVCCGDATVQNITKTRYHFRFKDSAATSSLKHAGNTENYPVTYDGSLTPFAGIVCIKN